MTGKLGDKTRVGITTCVSENKLNGMVKQFKVLVDILEARNVIDRYIIIMIKIIIVIIIMKSLYLPVLITL